MARETPLTPLHEAAGAKMVTFAGWRLPMIFSSVAEEAAATRTTAGLCDISHMGVVRIFGPDAYAAARGILTRDPAAIPINCSAYSFICNDRGGVVDDLFLMSETEDAVRLVVNASNHTKDVAWIAAHLPPGSRAALDDQLGRTFGLALQGPRSQDILKSAGFRGRLPMVFGAFFHAVIGRADLLVSRTGYTGEDGFELFGAAGDGQAVCQALLAAGEGYGLVPAGLAARDVLRQEMGYPLWGQDLDEQTTPIEAGLGWAVDWTGEFVGRSALECSKPARRRIGFRIEGQGVARHGDHILLAGSEIGLVTSGIYSHNLGAAIGQGYVSSSINLEPGRQIQISSRGRPLDANVAIFPFVPKRTRPSWAQLRREGDL